MKSFLLASFLIVTSACSSASFDVRGTGDVEDAAPLDGDEGATDAGEGGLSCGVPDGATAIASPLVNGPWTATGTAKDTLDGDLKTVFVAPDFQATFTLTLVSATPLSALVLGAVTSRTPPETVTFTIYSLDADGGTKTLLGGGSRLVPESEAAYLEPFVLTPGTYTTLEIDAQSDKTWIAIAEIQVCSGS